MLYSRWAATQTVSSSASSEFADRDAAEALRHRISIGEEFGFTRRASDPGETPLRQTFVLTRPGHELPMPS